MRDSYDPGVSGPRPVTAAEAAEWGLRLPRSAVTVVVPVLLVFLIVATVATDPWVGYTAELTESWWGLLDAFALGLLTAAFVLLPLVPEVGVWVVAGGAAGVWVGDLHTLRGVWAAAAAVFLLLAVTDAAARLRQRATAAAWGSWPIRSPAEGGTPSSSRSSRGQVQAGWLLPIGVIASGLLAVAGLVGYAHDAAAVHAFRSRAVVSDARVESVAPDVSAVRVVVDGREYRVPVVSVTPERGDVVSVRYDPDGARAERVDDAFDPTGALVLTGAGLALGVGLASQWLSRRRRLERLVTAHGDGLTVLATRTYGTRVELAALDAAGRAFAVLPHVGRLDDPPPIDDPEPEPDPDEREWDDLSSRPASELTDAEARRMATLWARQAEPRPVLPGAGDTLPSWRSHPVEVIGLCADDCAVLLRERDADVWYVCVAGPRDARTIRALFSPRAGRRPAMGPGSGWAAFWDVVDGAAARFARATGAWLSWFVAPVAGAFMYWIWVEPGERSFRAILLCGGAAVLGWRWSLAAQPLLALSPQALTIRAAFVDRVVPWHDVVSILSESGSLVVRTRQGEDGESLHLVRRHAALTRPILRGDPTLDEVAADLDARRRRAVPGPPPRLLVRPSLAVLAGGYWLVCAVTGVLLAT